MAAKRVAQVFIRLSQTLRTAESCRRIRRIVWPVPRHRDRIAADGASGAREHEQTRADRIRAIGLVTVQAIEGKLAFGNETRRKRMRQGNEEVVVKSSSRRVESGIG